MGWLTRRRLLLLGGTAVPGALLGYQWLFGSAEDVIVAILHRRVGYLKVDSGSFATFAREYLVFRERYRGELQRLAVVSFPLRFVTPYSLAGLGHPIRRLEDNVVSQYLLSTDFFLNGADESAPVQYLSFYDPQLTVCRNPFANEAGRG